MRTIAPFVTALAVLYMTLCARAQDVRFGGLSEDQIQQVEKSLGMDRYEILRIQKQFPQPTKFAPADKLASEAIAREAAVVLENKLPDFGSSRIRYVKAVLRQEWNSFNRSYHICGEINPKTKYGAYGGWHIFLAQRNKANNVEVIFDDGSINSFVVSTVCIKSADNPVIADFSVSYTNLIMPRR